MRQIQINTQQTKRMGCHESSVKREICNCKANIKNEGNSQINNITDLGKLKKEQTNLKVSRRKDIVKTKEK